MRLNLSIFLMVLFLVAPLYSQIINQNPKYNAVKEIVKIPDGMTYEEFTIVQRTLDWKKILASAFIPGYIHFYTKHNDEAWRILGIRLIGGGFLGYAIYDQLRYTNSFTFLQDGLTDELQKRSQRNFIFFSVGIILNMIGYGYDWAHGDWIIEKERNEIYFKYGLKKDEKLGLSYNPDFKVFGINYSLKF